MRAKEFILELFHPSKAAPYHWVTAKQAIAQMSDGEELVVNFIDHPDDVFAIEFSVGRDFEMTGKGNVSEIFSTVIEVVKQFIKRQRMDEFGGALYFTAEEPSRAKMYDTLAKRVAKQVGWHVVPYEEMAADPRMQTAMSYGDFVFVLEPGSAPEHRQSAQQPQHKEFLPIFYVYSKEDESLPILKIRAKRSSEAEEYVIKHVPEYKGAHPMGVFAGKTPMPFEKDLGTVPKPPPKSPERVPTELEKKLRDKIGA